MRFPNVHWMEFYVGFPKCSHSPFTKRTTQKSFLRKKQKRPVLVALRVGDDAAVLLSEEKQRPFWASSVTSACITAKLGLARALLSETVSWGTVSWPARWRAFTSSISDVLRPVAAVNSSWHRRDVSHVSGKYTYTPTHPHARTHARTHAHTHPHIHTHTPTHTHARTHACTHAHTHTRLTASFPGQCYAFSALTLLVGWQEGHPACM